MLLGARAGGLIMPTAQSITIYRGWTFTVELPQLDRAGAARNVTGSSFAFVITQSGQDIATIPLTINNAATGQISGVLNHAATASLPPRGTAGIRYAVTETLPSGAKELRAYGDVAIATPIH